MSKNHTVDGSYTEEPFYLKNEPPYTNEGRNEPYCFLTGSEIKASLFLPDAVN